MVTVPRRAFLCGVIEAVGHIGEHEPSVINIKAIPKHWNKKQKIHKIQNIATGYLL